MLTLLILYLLQPQPLKTGWWRWELVRPDSNLVVFNVELKKEQGKPVMYVRNASERLKITNIHLVGDSVFIDMPVFESQFRGRIHSPKSFSGIWVKGTSTNNQVMLFAATHGFRSRFETTKKAQSNISGRWAVTFTRPNNTTRPAIAEFQQKEQQLTGTFLTPSGDYRFLEGSLSADTMRLTTFDGSHAYSFVGRILGDSIRGHFYSGASHHERWSAAKNENASLPEDVSAVYLKEGEDRITFRFPDLDSNLVSLTDERFHNKVVIVQLMGSWCPNCMDETEFLSDYYKKNKKRGVEVVSLAYEYSTDFSRSRKSLMKFKDKFDVSYPMLITGVRTADSLRTEKTLPQLTPVRALPTTLFIGKDGSVKKIHTGFTGPGTGERYEAYKKEFNETIERLLKE